ncbi:MAG TPA: hypothetical protein DCL77_14395 [Prolixibacteraceae bacterium]|jgi:triacylglycerol esterase/lipase EstA (alpha/beta hydrolase family)|nr:hypothetical protein [Prolixibacteraceae bacterium]
MKHTFPTVRSKIRGFFPYLVKDEQGQLKYLFEVCYRTSCREILAIEKVFEDSEMVFATLEERLLNYQPVTDAANLYEVGGRSLRPVYLYRDGKFWESEKVEENETRTLKLTGGVREFRFY